MEYYGVASLVIINKKLVCKGIQSFTIHLYAFDKKRRTSGLNVMTKMCVCLWVS